MFEKHGKAHKGVLKVENASNEQLPTQKLVNISKIEMYAIQFGDAQGRAHTTTGFRIGNEWYLDLDNGETWANKLRPMSEWLSKQADAAVGAKESPTVPKADDVDIMGGP